MSILSDKSIRRFCESRQMIEPFSEKQTGEGVISYGLSSYGYDARCVDEFFVFDGVAKDVVLDPKAFDPKAMRVVKDEGFVVIPPHSFVLTRTLEYFRIPRSVLVICLGKSTYARCGLVVNVTPLEPEWEGYVTMELSNTTPNPLKVYANEGICQFLFLDGGGCDTSYADRKGKYQGQQKITLAKVLPQE